MQSALQVSFKKKINSHPKPLELSDIAPSLGLAVEVHLARLGMAQQEVQIAAGGDDSASAEWAGDYGPQPTCGWGGKPRPTVAANAILDLTAPARKTTI